MIRGDNEQVLLQQNKELRQQYDSLKKDIPLMEEALKSSKVCAIANHIVHTIQLVLYNKLCIVASCLVVLDIPIYDIHQVDSTSL